jgi:peptidoglycan/xylan/chitin deacetylase (PgdA/CDA1 family)
VLRLPIPRLLPLFLVLLFGAACAPSLRAPAGGAGAPAPAAAVDRFLRLAQEKNYVEMGWIFGTEKGPAIETHPRDRLEKQMYALASVLQHDRYELRGEGTVPGRGMAAMQYRVALIRGASEKVVPITAVRGPGGRWFVEVVDVEALTGGR